MDISLLVKFLNLMQIRGKFPYLDSLLYIEDDSKVLKSCEKYAYVSGKTAPWPNFNTTKTMRLCTLLAAEILAQKNCPNNDRCSYLGINEVWKKCKDLFPDVIGPDLLFYFA